MKSTTIDYDRKIRVIDDRYKSKREYIILSGIGCDKENFCSTRAEHYSSMKSNL